MSFTGHWLNKPLVWASTEGNREHRHRLINLSHLCRLQITFQGCRLHWSSSFLIPQLKQRWQYWHSTGLTSHWFERATNIYSQFISLTGLVHRLSTIQECQYCHLCFSCGIRKELDQWSLQPWNVILFYSLISNSNSIFANIMCCK